jgi:uncharacterized protein YlxW (UPF0749 family)
MPSAGSPGAGARPWFGYRPTMWSILVPLAAAVAGLIFATSFTTAQGTEIRSAGRDLPGLIREQNRNVAAKAGQVRQLQEDVDRLSAAAAPGNTEVQRLAAQAQALAATVGTQAVHGPALTVRLDDAHRTAASLPRPYGPDDIVVHQQDVQAVVNALWAGGAEAMMIQDQRAISTSAVRCVGNTLILQGRVYSPPYVITAIGDQNRLATSLEADPQVQIYREWVDAVGLGYEVTREADRRLPAYSGSVNQQLATVSR